MSKVKQLATLAISGCLLLGLLVVNAEGRAQYKSVIDKMDAGSDAEKKVQAAVKADKCNSCHVKGKKKSFLSDYGKKLHEAMGGENFKFDKAAWKKTDGKYSDESVKSLLDAVNKAGK